MNREIKFMEPFDYARIKREFGKFWLLLGEYRHTSKDAGVWIDQDGNERNWSYISWKIVAYGETWDEFIESAKEYFRLCDMTMVDYLEEKIGVDLSYYKRFFVDANMVMDISNMMKQTFKQQL
jgi:hypothetical protein